MTYLDQTLANNFDFRHIGWKYYNGIKKKAMEQEFSWSGLVISLSIAFFIVLSASSILRFTYVSMEKNEIDEHFIQNKVYQLEVYDSLNREKYLQPATVDREKIESISSLYLA